MTLTIDDIRTLASLEGKTDMETITLLQTGAAKSGDDDALNALCKIKAYLVGLAD